jgi:hypothetical protein
MGSSGVDLDRIPRDKDSVGNNHSGLLTSLAFQKFGYW